MKWIKMRIIRRSQCLESLIYVCFSVLCVLFFFFNFNFCLILISFFVLQHLYVFCTTNWTIKELKNKFFTCLFLLFFLQLIILFGLNYVTFLLSFNVYQCYSLCIRYLSACSVCLLDLYSTRRKIYLFDRRKFFSFSELLFMRWPSNFSSLSTNSMNSVYRLVQFLINLSEFPFWKNSPW